MTYRWRTRKQVSLDERDGLRSDRAAPHQDGAAVGGARAKLDLVSRKFGSAVEAALCYYDYGQQKRHHPRAPVHGVKVRERRRDDVNIYLNSIKVTVVLVCRGLRQDGTRIISAGCGIVAPPAYMYNDAVQLVERARRARTEYDEVCRASLWLAACRPRRKLGGDERSARARGYEEAAPECAERSS